MRYSPTGPRRRKLIAAAAAGALLALGVTPASAATEETARGFSSPLGFAVGTDGTLYVAEAFIGQLTAVDKKGNRKTLVAGVEGQQTGGVDAKGKGTVSYTLSLPPEFADGPPADTTLNRVLPNGKTRATSLLAYEQSANPDQVNTYGLIGASQGCLDAYGAVEEPLGLPAVYEGIIESNPYAVAIDGRSRVVADAAGNSIVRVSPNGKKVRTVAVLPPIPQELTADALAGLIGDVNDGLAQAGKDPIPEDSLDPCIGASYDANPVPTDVEVGPDGHYYVSALPGFPEAPGAGKVFKVNRSSGAVTEVADGLTGAVDLAVAEDGTIYVAELFMNQVTKIPAGGGSRTSRLVQCPTAVEIGLKGQVLAAEGGICSEEPELGRILRVSL